MKIRLCIVIFLLVNISTFLPIYNIASTQDIDFRKVDFSSGGYDITYEILEGKNIGNIFSDIGFNLSDSLSGSEFHILLKNKKYELKEIYSLETNTVVTENTSVFYFDSYMKLKNDIEFSSELSNILSKIKIGNNFLEPVDNKKITTILSENSSIPIPRIFNQFLFPNFNSVINQLNYFNFLPLILGTDYEKYEAEFSFLQITGNFSINIYNELQEYFTISLRSIDSNIIMRSSWNKKSGLLQSLSIQFKYGGETNIFSIEFKDYRKIDIDKSVTDLSFFITNSTANLAYYNGPKTIEENLIQATEQIIELNQTEGFRYLISYEGLMFSWIWEVLNKDTQNYSSSEILEKTTFLSQLPPIIISNWDMYKGFTQTLSSIGESLLKQIQNYTIKIGNRTEYSITVNKFNVQFQEYEQSYFLLMNVNISYQREEVSFLASRRQIQEWDLATNSWFGYSNLGILQDFSIFWQEINHFYFDPRDIARETHYKWNYKIESRENVEEIPTFTTNIEKTSLSPIIVLSLVIVSMIRRIRKKKELKQ